MKNVYLTVLLSCLCISNFGYAGAKLKIRARVLSYNETRVKLKIGSKIKYLKLEKLAQSEVDSLTNFLNKEKDFYVSNSDLKDKEI